MLETCICVVWCRRAFAPVWSKGHFADMPTGLSLFSRTVIFKNHFTLSQVSIILFQPDLCGPDQVLTACPESSVNRLLIRQILLESIAWAFVAWAFVCYSVLPLVQRVLSILKNLRAEFSPAAGCPSSESLCFTRGPESSRCRPRPRRFARHSRFNLLSRCLWVFALVSCLKTWIISTSD